MAVIGSIRKRGGLLVTLVAGALALFVLQGLFSGNSVSREDTDILAVVNGNPIDKAAHQAELNDMASNYFLTNEKFLGNDNEELLQYRSEALEALINRKALESELEELGLLLTTEGSRAEAQDMFDPDGVALIPFADNFKDENGVFNADQFGSYIDVMEEPIGENEPFDRYKAKIQWGLVKRSSLKNRAFMKYRDLMMRSSYVPTYMAKRKFMEGQATAEYNFLYIPYKSIKDEAISEESLNLSGYLEKNKEKYVAQGTSVAVDFHAFRVIPSPDDSAAISTLVDSLYAQWQSVENDTTFLQDNADNVSAIPTYVTYNELPRSVIADTTLRSDVETSEYGKVSKIFAPELSGNTYYIHKVSEVVLDTVWTMEARQILFPNTDNAEYNQSLVNYLDSIKNGASFEAISDAIVSQFSQNINSAEFREEYPKFVGPGGKIKLLTDEAELYANDTELRDKLFAIADTGLYPELIKTDKFIYIVKVEKVKTFEKRENKFLLSTIDKVLKASPITRQLIYEQATLFYQGCRESKEAFYSKLQADSLMEQKVSLKLNYRGGPYNNRYQPSYGTYLNGIEDKNRTILDWAWQNDPSTAPKFVQLPEAYVIAVIAGKDKKGETISDAISTPQLRMQALNERKAERIIDQLSQMLKGDLVDIAQNYNEKYQLSGDSLAIKGYDQNHQMSNDNPYGNNVGPGKYLNEPKVMGRIFGMKKNTRSEPFRGEQGIFIVEVLNVDAGKEAQDGDYSGAAQSYLNEKVLGIGQGGQLGSIVEQAITNALRFSATVEDKRYNGF